MHMSAALVRSALRAQSARHLTKPTAAASQTLCARWNSSATGGSGRKNTRGAAGRKPASDKTAVAGGDGLYDPYKLYQEEHGKPGYREFNPDNLGDVDEFQWTEPAELMADKSWPQTSGTDMFSDLINISTEPPAPEKLEPILTEFYRRVGHKSLAEIELPTMSVEVPADDEDREALEIMKLSLLNNGRISMDDKNEIMESIIDELEHLRKDKTTLFKNVE